MKTRSRKPKKRGGSLSENVQIRRLDLNLFRVFDLCVPYFAAVAPMLQVTDMVATLPRRLALWSAKRDPIVLLKLPYKPITVEVEMVWHQRVTRDPGFRWIRDALTCSAAEFAANAEQKT